MTSEARERSWDQGEPVMFFRFARRTVVWCYTSSDREEVLGGDTYTPAAIERGRIRQGGERNKLSVTVTLPSTLPVADNWRPYPPSDPIVLTIFVRHAGETDAIAEWVGRVVGPKFDGPTLSLTGEPTTTTSRREGNLRVWQRGCGLVLYSQGEGMCNLATESIPVAAVLSAAEGVSVSAPQFAAVPRSLAGGRLEWRDVADELQQIAIVAHAGESITLADASADLVVGLAVTAHAPALWMEATVEAVDGLTVTAPEFAALPNGRLAGGYVQWTRADGLVEYRSINRHADNTVDLYYGAVDLVAGLVLRAYPGCAHTWADCGAYGNRANYGGDLWMPTKSPFDGSPVW